MSRCLDFDACRYDGKVIPNSFTRRLARHAELILVCPEVEIGLSTPRGPIRIVEQGGKRLLLQPSTGRDLTAAMTDFRSRFLASLFDVDGFVLKSRSPSCDVTGRRPGLFAEAVLERYPDHPVEDEERLLLPEVRELFLTRVFGARPVPRDLLQ